MLTLQEIETAVQCLKPDELKQLDDTVRSVLRRTENGGHPSVLDLPPLKIGYMIRPLTTDDDLLDEMLNDPRT